MVSLIKPSQPQMYYQTILVPKAHKKYSLSDNPSLRDA